MARTDEQCQSLSTLDVSPDQTFPTDEALVGSVPQDPEAFATLYGRYVREVYAYVRRRVASNDRGEEIVADVFEAALAGLSRYRSGPGGFRSWLFSIAHHKVVDSYRAARRAPVPWDDSNQPGNSEDLEESVATNDELKQLERLVQELPEQEREALLLRYWDGLSWQEVAAVLGKSEGAVKVAAHRTMKKLREKWEGRR